MMPVYCVNCGTVYVDTTKRQADVLHVPVPSANLMFANEAIGAEMCVLYLEIAQMAQ